MEGTELKAIRKAVRMTQAEFAEAMGVTSTFVGMMERSQKPIEPRTELAARYLALGRTNRTTPLPLPDPMERLIADALQAAGLAFRTGQGDGAASGMDFELPELGLAIEVKRFHSDRNAEQMARASDVIVAQGEVAARALAALIRGEGLTGLGA